MVYIGADHQGRVVKNDLLAFLKSSEVSFEEVGENNYSPEDDYPDFAAQVAIRVLADSTDKTKQPKGILLCGSGQGMAIAANRFKGIRAGLCWNLEEVALARSDDDINVLCLPKTAFADNGWQDIVKAFLETDFKKAPKYSRRIEKLDRLP